MLGDKVRLMQILVNLTKSLFKTTQAREIKFKAAYEGLSDQILVQIKDLQPASMDVRQSELFTFLNSSQRDNEARPFKPEGVSVGLLCSKKIIEQSGGSIIAAASGEGSSYCITLALQASLVTNHAPQAILDDS